MSMSLSPRPPQTLTTKLAKSPCPVPGDGAQPSRESGSPGVASQDGADPPPRQQPRRQDTPGGAHWAPCSAPVRGPAATHTGAGVPGTAQPSSGPAPAAPRGCPWPWRWPPGAAWPCAAPAASTASWQGPVARPMPRLWAGGWPACPPGRARAGRPTCYFETRGTAPRRSMSPGAGWGEEGRTFRTNVNFLHQIF